MDNSRETPDEGLYRAVTPLAKMLVGLLPGGGTLAELVTMVIADPANKRRDTFLMELARRVDELAVHRGFTLNDLVEGSEPSALLLQAVQVATRSTGEQKLEALKQVAASGACHKPEERQLSFIVLGLLDRLSEAHISMLRV